VRRQRALRLRVLRYHQHVPLSHHTSPFICSPRQDQPAQGAKEEGPGNPKLLPVQGADDSQGGGAKGQGGGERRSLCHIKALPLSLPTQRRHLRSCITIVPTTARLNNTPCATASNYCTCNSRYPLRIGACGHVVQPVALQLRKERQKQEVAGKRKMERKAVSASSLTQLQLDAAARTEAFEAAADAAGDGDDAAGGALPDASRKAYYKEFLKVTLPHHAMPHLARPHAHTHARTHDARRTHRHTHTHTHTHSRTHARTHGRTHGGAHQTYVHTFSAQHRLWMQRT
jgi:hypothetical protein